MDCRQAPQNQTLWDFPQNFSKFCLSIPRNIRIMSSSGIPLNITTADFFCSYSSLNGLPADVIAGDCVRRAVACGEIFVAQFAVRSQGAGQRNL